MFRVLTVLAILISSITFGDTFYGKVELYEGMTVESRQPYSYYALAAQEGSRLLLPPYLNVEYLHESQNDLRIEGTVERLMCTDMSRACPSGFFSVVDEVFIHTGIVSIVPFDRFHGHIKHFTGRYVETPHMTYDYFALVTDEHRRVSVPQQIDPDALEEIGLMPEVTVYGDARAMICSDMSPACGPDLLTLVSTIQMNFKDAMID